MEAPEIDDFADSDYLETLGVDDFVTRNECPRGLGPNPVCSGSQEDEMKAFAKSISRVKDSKAGKPKSSKAAVPVEDDEEVENVENFDLLSKPRVIVHRGNVEKKRDSMVKASSSKRRLYLLNDMLLVTSKSTGYFTSAEQVLVHHIIYLDQISIIEFSSASPKEFGIFVTTSGDQYHFIADNEGEKRIWVEEIEKATHAIMAAKPMRLPGWHLKVLPGTLWAACFLNDLDTLRKHIQNLQDNYDIATCIEKLNEADPTGMMPLHWAAYNGYLMCVKELVEAGANIDVLNSGLNTPLMIAASRGYYDVVNYLVNSNADIFTRNLKDRDALFMSVLYGYKYRSLRNIIECLKRRCEELKRSNLCSTSFNIWDQQDSAGCTPLHECAARNLSWAVQLLVDAGANVNSKHGRNGLTPLQLACSVPEPNKETVRAFLDRGAHPNWCDASGRTAFSMAICTLSTRFQTADQAGASDKPADVESHRFLQSGQVAVNKADLKSHFVEFTFPVLLEIVKKGGRYMEEEIANLPSSSAKVSLDETRAQWLTEQQPESFPAYVASRSLYLDEKLWRPDRSSNSCNLCLQVFQFMTRHHCRHCGLLCCGLCTSKRMVLAESASPIGGVRRPRSKRKEGQQERVCDGCFNKLRFDCAESENRLREQERLAKSLETSVKLSQKEGASSSSSSSASTSLFAGASVQQAVGGGGTPKGGKLANTAAVMQDAMVALNERGEKLNQLAEKSEELSQAAGDFYRVAKLLAESKKRSAERFW